MKVILRVKKGSSQAGLFLKRVENGMFACAESQHEATVFTLTLGPTGVVSDPPMPIDVRNRKRCEMIPVWVIVRGVPRTLVDKTSE